MKEEWRQIPGYEGHYDVSNFGNIRTLKNEKVLLRKPYTRKGGYKIINLCRRNVYKNIYVHRLVAMTFIPIPDELKHIPMSELEVNHKDMNPTNNHVDNLEWCTRDYNAKYGRQVPITQFGLDGSFIKNWPGVREAARGIGGEKNTAWLGAAAREKVLTRCGYIWRFTKPEYRPGYKLDVSDINTTGKPRTIPVTQFSLEGKFIKTWEGGTPEIVKSLNTYQANIQRCCTGNVRSAAGFIWRYTKPEYGPSYVLPNATGVDTVRNIPREISQFDQNGNFLRHWDSIDTVMKETGMSRDSVWRRCRAPATMNKGYIWRYRRSIYIPEFNLFNLNPDDAYCRSVDQLQWSNRVLAGRYQSIMVAYKAINPLGATNGWRLIHEACHGIVVSAYGYRWEFTPDIQL